MVVEYIGIVTGKSSMRSSKYGIFYSIDLVDEEGEKFVDPDTGGSMNFKISVKDIKDEKDPRNNLKIGDKVRITCQRREESCSVTPVQDIEILASNVPIEIERRCLFGKVVKRNDPKDYGRGVIKMYVLLETPDNKEYRLMIRVKDPINDKVIRLKKGDEIEVTCDDATESEWCSVDNDNVKFIKMSESACEIVERRRASPMEAWFLGKTGKSFIDADIRSIFKFLTIAQQRPIRASYFGIGITRSSPSSWRKHQDFWGESYDKRIHLVDEMKNFGWITEIKRDETRYVVSSKGNQVLDEFNMNFPTAL